jgi:hypothetical protein
MTERLTGSALALLTVAALVLTPPVFAAESQLTQQILAHDGWSSYQVPMIATAGVPCCYEFHDRNLKGAGCDLDGHSRMIGSIDHGPVPADDTLAVYVHVSHARVDKVNALAASCPVHVTGELRRLDGVSGADSVAWLAREVQNDARFGATADAELSALAMHEDATATTALAALSDATHPRKLREQALFWSGQSRGASGARLAEHTATSDPDPEMRVHAVFVLSESRSIDGYASIHRIAQTDSSEHVREQALFWMSQTNDARAKNDILGAIEHEPSDKVREQAVFALSQLKEHDGDAALIALVRGKHPRKVKEQALFWLGESGSDEALHFFDELLTQRESVPHDG